MYLTAHHVEQPVGKSGINVFLHEHRNVDIERFSWRRPDISRIADVFPGVRINERCDIPPGGNSVISYLDVVAADSIETERIVVALEEFEKNELDEMHGSVEKVLDEIGIRFGIQRQLTVERKEEYRRLKERVIELRQSPVQFAAESSLDVRVAVMDNGDDERFVFTLPDKSIETIRGILGQAWIPPLSVGIDLSTKQDFERLHGDVIPHIIDDLTSLRTEQVLELGGVTFRDAKTDRPLIEWPRKSKH